MSKVLIEEEFLDTLISKSLPKEHEVLMENYGLSEEEEEYYLLILLLFSDIVKFVREWIKSFGTFPPIDELDEFFFDDVFEGINNLFKEHFVSVTLLLSLFFNEGKTIAFRQLNATPVDFVNESSALGIIKHQNHQVISNLIDEVSINMKDIVWRGVKDKLSVDEIANNLVENGLKAKGKFSVEHRARMIAVTERNRAYNTAKLQTFHNYGVKLVDIVTMHDDKVCTICLNNEENNPYSIEEVQDLIPSHTFCRCTVEPHFDDEKYVLDLVPEDFVVDLTDY